MQGECTFFWYAYESVDTFQSCTLLFAFGSTSKAEIYIFLFDEWTCDRYTWTMCALFSQQKQLQNLKIYLQFGLFYQDALLHFIKYIIQGSGTLYNNFDFIKDDVQDIIFDLFDSLFKGAQNLYCSPEKRKSYSVFVWQANVLFQEIRILKNFTLDHSNIRTITILQL